MGQTAAKVLEGSHQQHGFLSITYTQAVTKNVRHKLITRPERQTRSGTTTASQRVTSDPLADGSPQYLREILLTAQPFDVVLSCPLLATVAGVFQVESLLLLPHCENCVFAAVVEIIQSHKDKVQSCLLCQI